MPEPKPAFEFSDLPSTSAEEAAAAAKRAQERLAKPPAPPAPAAPAPVRAAPQPVAPVAPVAPPAAPEPPAQPPARPTLEMVGGRLQVAKPEYKSPITQAREAVASEFATSGNAPETIRSMATMAADEQTRQAIAAQTELRQAAKQRAVAFLAQRGFEEQVSLLPDGIDLSATRKKMEAAGLQKKARERGYNNWFEVPTGPERDQAQKDVAMEVEQNLLRATTVGKGAIFIDPDPAGLREVVGALPVGTAEKLAIAAVIPTAKATYAPTGSQFQTESPLAYPMRVVNMVGAATMAPAEAVLQEAEPLRRISEARAKVESGEMAMGDYLDELDVITRDSLKVATGIDFTDDIDWRDVIARDPEAQKRLYGRIQTDPAGFMVGNELADQLVQYFDAPDMLTHLFLVPTGFGVDVITPDPFTPTLGLAAGAAKAGARLAGDTADLTKAARNLRAAASREGATIQEVLDVARRDYRGLDEALSIRVGSRARVPTDVAAQIRRLETEAERAAEAARVAEERVGLVAAEQDQFEVAQQALQARHQQARAELDLAEARAASVDEAADIYATVGAPAVKKSQRLQAAAEEAKQQARIYEEEAGQIQREHELALGRLESQNTALVESIERENAAREALVAAQRALKEAKGAKKAKVAPIVSEELVALDEAVGNAKKALDREDAELIAQRQRLTTIQKENLSASTTPDPFSPEEIAETSRVLKQRLRSTSTVEDVRAAAQGGTTALAEHVASTSSDPTLRLIASRLGATRVRVTLAQRAEGTFGAAKAASIRLRAAAIDPSLDIPELGWVLHPKGNVVPHVKFQGGEVTELHIPIPVGATKVPDEILVHELVHVETAELLRAPIGTLTPAQQAARADLNTLYRHAKATLSDTGMDTYGLWSLDEFVAEAMANPAFQKILKELPPPPGFAPSVKSSWSAWLDSLARLLGFGDEPTVLSEVTAALDQMMLGYDVGAAKRVTDEADALRDVERAADEAPTRAPEPTPEAPSEPPEPPAPPEPPSPPRGPSPPPEEPPLPPEPPAPAGPAPTPERKIPTREEILADIEAQKARRARAKADYDAIVEQRKLAQELAAKEAKEAKAQRALDAQMQAGAAEQEVERAKKALAAAQQEVKEVQKTHRLALMDVEKPVKAISDRAARALEMHRRAAELEQESAEGIRLITTGTDIPGERAAVSSVGERLKAEREVAQRALSDARANYRRASVAARRGDAAAERVAEQEIRQIEGMMGAQMRADMLRERSRIWIEEAQALATDIENGVAGLRNRRKVDPRNGGILMGAVLDEGRNGYLIDADALRAKLEQEFGLDAIRWWVERAGDDRDLWVRALGLDGRRMVPLTHREGLLLQQGEKGLLTGLERTRPAAAAEAQVEALLLLRRDPARKAAAFFDTNPKAWGEYVGNSLDTWVRALDPTAARIGEVSADVEQISRAANRMASNARDELLMLNRLAKLPQGFKGIYQASMRGFGSPQAMIDISLRYIDSTEPLEVFGRHTILNAGDETLWQRAKRQFQTDPRVATHDQMVQYAQSKGLSLEEMLASDQPGISNRPLLGLSRMWLKSGTGASERQSAYLFGEARRLIATSNSFQEFSDAMKRATQRAWTDKELAGGGGFGPGAVEVHPQRAIGYGARNVAQAAVQADVNDLFVRGLGGIFTPEEANDAIKAATYNFDTIADPGNVWQTYARLGAPYTQRSLRDAESAVARTQALLQTGTTRSGEPVFMLSSQARALDETLDKVVKETHAQYAGARDLMSAWNLKHIGDFQQFWKTSVTLGLLVPRPSYFMTNVFGNFSQMWLSAGPSAAARISFQSFSHNIPFIGKHIDTAMRMTSEAMGDVPLLGSITNAWVNPHLNRVFAGEPGLFRAANGITYDFETVRKWMVEDGVMTNFMQEEFGHLFARAQAGTWKTRMAFLQDDIFAWAGEIELRMRAALYMDLLQKGATRGEARDVTLRALYDWNGALGKFEAEKVTWFIPFYRFIKLGVRQWAEECITLPLRRPVEQTYKALMGQSGLARVNQQMKITTIPEIFDDGDYQNDQEKWDAMARYRGLDYLNKRVYWAERNDLERQALYQGTRGQFMPYSMNALPGMTAVDMGALAVLPFYALAGLGLEAASLVNPDAERLLAPDWGAPFIDAALGMNGPLTQPLIAAWAEASGYGSQRSSEIARLKPGEEAVARTMGLPTFVGKDYQGIYGTAATKSIVNSLPVVLQVPSWLDAFAYENPYADRLRLQADNPQGTARDIAEFLAFGTRQMSGVAKSYPFDPEAVQERRQKAVGDRMRKEAEAAASPLREKQSPKPR